MKKIEFRYLEKKEIENYHFSYVNNWIEKRCEYSRNYLKRLIVTIIYIKESRGTVSYIEKDSNRYEIYRNQCYKLIENKKLKKLEKLFKEEKVYCENIHKVKNGKNRDLEKKNIDILKKIVSASPLYLNDIIRNQDNEEWKNFLENIDFSFLIDCYDNFVSRDKKIVFDKVQTEQYYINNWSKKSFLECINRHVCPYCNCHLIYSLFKSKKENFFNIFEDYDISDNLANATISAQVDHAFPKEKYPFLAMSLYNLVPSCSVCNTTTLKGKVAFSEVLFLNPYEYGVDEFLDFKLISKNEMGVVSERNIIKTIFSKTSELAIGYSVKQPIIDVNLTLKAIYMVEFFYIRERANQCIDMIQEKLKLCSIYTDKYIETLSNFYELKLDLKNDGIDYFSNFENRIFGKIQKDIYSEITNYRANLIEYNG